MCKRPGFHEDYLDTFNRPNVELVDASSNGVDRITPRGVVVNGVEYEVDCIVHATGFMTAEYPYTTRLGFDIVGPEGASLSEKWADGPSTFHGLFTQGFPNLIIFPDAFQQVAASANFVFNLIESSLHAAHVISAIRSRGKRYFDVDPQAEEEWVAPVIARGSDAAANAFREACTPGVSNNQGHFADRKVKYGPYPMRTTEFFNNWKAWRREAELEGLVLYGTQPGGGPPAGRRRAARSPTPGR
jgi:cyclohexanone monooxygenase